MSMLAKFSIIFGGMLFGFGLAYSGAAIPEVVLSFLYLQDLGLIFVIGAGLAVTAFAYNLLPRLLHKPLFAHAFVAKARERIGSRTILGAVIFGVGWGISGICPGTSLAAFGMGNLPLLYGIAGMFLGTFIYGYLRTGN